MNIGYIREFVILVKEGNFLNAAESLFISQSSLSKHIQRMEYELGQELFERSKKKIELTMFGKEFFKCANELLSTYDGFQEKMKIQSDRNELSFAIPAQAYEYGINDILCTFDQNYSKCHIAFCECGSIEYHEMLRSQKVDFAFIKHATPINDSEIISVPYLTDRLVAVLPKDHPLANRKKISVSELVNEKMIGHYDANGVVSQITKQAFFDAGIPFKYDWNVSLGQSILDLVGRGMGISIRSKMATERLHFDNIAVIDLDKKYQIFISLLYLANREMTPEMQLFINFMLAHSPESSQE